LPPTGYEEYPEEWQTELRINFANITGNTGSGKSVKPAEYSSTKSEVVETGAEVMDR